MMSKDKLHESDVHDLSLGVIHALSMLDVKVLSYMQLRRLNAALIHAAEDVARETAERSDSDKLGDTVRVTSPRFNQPR
jgi:hypothetical protein